VTYHPIDQSRLIVGVIATDAPGTTRKTRSLYRAAPEQRARYADLVRAADAVHSLGPGIVEDFAQRKELAERMLRSDPEIFRALQRELTETFNSRLNQSHDFVQLVKLIRGYAETLLSEKEPDLSPELAAEKYQAEGAIYFSTRLMLAKIDALKYVREVNLALGGETRFGLHPLVLKYVRIYEWQAKQREVDIRVTGECYRNVRYNADAVGTVIQAILDNLVKYAPAGSQATIVFSPQGDHVDLTFVSLGPKIDDDEQERIFLEGVRARAAQAVEDGGLGLGLGVARRLSDAMGLDLRCSQEQESDAQFPERFRTEFSIRFESSAEKR